MKNKFIKILIFITLIISPILNVKAYNYNYDFNQFDLNRVCSILVLYNLHLFHH